MKRHSNLWENVVSFEALLTAAEQARKGKRFRPSVASFHFDLERALLKLREELTAKTYRDREPTAASSSPSRSGPHPSVYPPRTRDA